MAKREGSILAKIKSLVSAECANHQNTGSWGKKDYCWAKEKSNGGLCVFFSDLESPRCRYFEESVLPLDKDLKGIYSSQTLSLEIQEGQRRMVQKKCERCPEIFMAKSNAQRFCPPCQKWNENEKTRVRMANLRKKPNGVSLVTV